jgi:hypothetical protein
MPKKKKTLPKDFEALCKQGDVEALKRVFDTCELDARGGYTKATALAFCDCPPELARWLVEQGADLQATDTYGYTPLHEHARSWRGNPRLMLDLGADVHSSTASLGTPLHLAADGFRATNAAILLEHGARVDAKNREGRMPLELALERCRPSDLEDVRDLARVLLKGGAEITDKAREFLRKAGKEFEFIRADYNPDSVDAASAALQELYALLRVAPAPPRRVYDGVSPITVTTTQWEDQHEELWQFLVPGTGAASTVQGEVIRISGRIGDEIHRNGGANWDRDYNLMADAFVQLVQMGAPFEPVDLDLAKSLVAEVKRREGEPDELARLAVKWVLQNPTPIKLQRPAYRR